MEVSGLRSGSDQRNAPCRHHVSARAARTVQFLPANLAAEYQRHNTRLDFVFDIGPRDRILCAARM